VYFGLAERRWPRSLTKEHWKAVTPVSLNLNFAACVARFIDERR
jgi:hypothetical protein